ATLNAIRDGVVLCNLEGKVLRCNRSFAEVAGRPIRLLIGERLDTVLPDSPIASSFEKLLESRARETITCWIGERWFQIGFDPVFLDSGALAGAGFMLSGIAERKQAEDALQNANQRLSSALSSFADTYFALDYNWRLREANETARQKIFKRPAPDVIERAVWEEFPEALHPEFYRQVQIAVAE